MRRLRRTPLGSLVTAVAVGVSVVTALIVYGSAVVVADRDEAGTAIVVGSLVALLVALGVGVYVAQTVTTRIRRIQWAAREVADGNFAARIPVDSSGELGTLASTFNQMQRRLAEHDNARKQFIANASHELRTPIFSLGGFVELLEEDDPSPEEREEFVRTMRQQIDRLTKLTADLLNLSQLDAGGIVMQRHALDLCALAREAAREFGPRADLRGSRLEVRTPDGPVFAAADPERVRQIIRILLDNAFTHTPDGTNVTITTYTADSRAELTVSDDGPGIPMRIQERIFERFYTATGSGGSGLGLAIARELAQRMDGRVSIASSKRFTAFTLDLPPAARGELPAPPAVEPAGAGV